MTKLFANIIKGNNVLLRPPTKDELKYIQKLCSDHKTMKEVGGTVELSDERAIDWYSRKISSNDNTDYYCLIFNNDDIPVGEISFHSYDSKEKSARFNVKIEYIHRGNGYAKEAMILFLNYYFNGFGGEIMIDDIALDNTVSHRVFLNFGFKHDNSRSDVFLVKLTKNRYNELY